MPAFLPRTSSVPALQQAILTSSKSSIPRHDSFCGFPLPGHSMYSGTAPKPNVSLHLHPGGTRGTHLPTVIRRVSSENDVIRSLNVASPVHAKSTASGPSDLPENMPEEGFVPNSSDPSVNYFVGSWPVNGMSLETLGFSGNGCYRGVGTCSEGEPNKMGSYYEELLKSNPNDSLVLGNYAKYLLDVQKDTRKAEEYYGRAILANPGDADLLSHYGKLIWDKDRDEVRANYYFERALCASPDDCMALGSYAHFLWEAEEEEDVAKQKHHAELVASF